MSNPRHTLKLGLLALCGVSGTRFVIDKIPETLGMSGLLYADGTPIGGDFINLWATGRLILSGQSADVYSSAAFMAYERSLTGAGIGLRVWAYPAHSLLVAWPFGLAGFFVSLVLWSLLGLFVLGYGARRIGFDWLETAIIVGSPASLLSLYFGQSGNLMVGLLLIAMSLGDGRTAGPIMSAALLTLKPQGGFLVPVLWLFERRWKPVAIAALAVLVTLGVSTMVFGLEVWRSYLGDTLDQLSQLERHGTGPFMNMIPSVFMAMRITLGDSDIALLVHSIFAALVMVVLIVRLLGVADPMRRVAMILVATTLMTPYLHNYDLGMLLCGALLVARRWPATTPSSLGVNLLVVAALLLPFGVMLLNSNGLPISALLILPLLFLA